MMKSTLYILSLLVACSVATNYIFVPTEVCDVASTFYSTPPNLGTNLANSGNVWNPYTSYTNFQFPFTPNDFQASPSYKEYESNTMSAICNNGKCTCDLTPTTYTSVPLYPGANLNIKYSCSGNDGYLLQFVSDLQPVYTSSYLYSTSGYIMEYQEMTSCTGSCSSGSCLSFKDQTAVPTFTNIVESWSNGHLTCCSTTGQGYLAAAAKPIQNSIRELHVFKLSYQGYRMTICRGGDTINCYDSTHEGLGLTTTLSLNVPSELIVGVYTLNYQPTVAVLGISGERKTGGWGEPYDYTFKGKSSCVNKDPKFPTSNPITWHSWVTPSCDYPVMYSDSLAYMPNATSPLAGFLTLESDIGHLQLLTNNHYNMRVSSMKYSMVNGEPSFQPSFQYTDSYLTGQLSVSGSVSVTTYSVAQLSTMFGSISLSACTAVLGGELSSYCNLTVSWKSSVNSVTLRIDDYDKSNFKFTPVVYFYPGVTKYRIRVLVFREVSTVSFGLFSGGNLYTKLTTNSVFIGPKLSNDTIAAYDDAGTQYNQAYGVSNMAFSGYPVDMVILMSVVGFVFLLYMLYFTAYHITVHRKFRKIYTTTRLSELKSE